jgi:hypothetical protein
MHHKNYHIVKCNSSVYRFTILRFIVVLFSTVILTSCLDPYLVSIGQETEKLVIESLLTDDKTVPFVRLSFTVQFGTLEGGATPVRGAYIEVKDNDGKATVYRSVTNVPGLYEPADKNFRGVAGKNYTLTIKLTNGATYLSAVEPMAKLVEVTNMYAELKKPSGDGKFLNTGYQIYIDVKDTKSVENYYRWVSWGVNKRKSTGVPVGIGGGRCCDQCWVRLDNSAIMTLSDAGVDGGLLLKRPVYFSPFFYYGNHYVEVKQYNISRGAYQFWKRYQEQTSRTGTIFDPLPAPISGNVVNTANANDVALGYFEVASVATKRIVIPDTLFGKVTYDRLTIPEGSCTAAFPFSVYDSYPPPGW